MPKSLLKWNEFYSFTNRKLHILLCTLLLIGNIYVKNNVLGLLKPLLRKHSITSLNTYIVCAELVKGLWCIKKMVVVEETDNTENVLSEKTKCIPRIISLLKLYSFKIWEYWEFMRSPYLWMLGDYNQNSASP